MMLLCLAAFLVALAFASVIRSWRERLAQALGTSAHDDGPRPGSCPPVTLVVPARDAASTLAPLLQDLHAQRDTDRLLEVLVVDDGSSDGTADIARAMARSWPALHVLSAEGEGKKAAIATGVRAARGEWVLLTDADARCGPLRVAHMLRMVQAEQPDLLLMPVVTGSDGGFIQRIQADEQAALLGVAAATAMAGTPVLASGANMAFRRSAFLEVGGYAGDRWASGDDIFLLRRMRKAGRRISYLFDPEAAVTVQAEPDFPGFWRQRLRWAGKMRGVGGAGNWGAAAALLLPWLLVVVTCGISATQELGQGLLRDAALLLSAWSLWLLPLLGLLRTVRSFTDAAQPDAAPQRGRGVFAVLSVAAFTLYAPVVALASLFVRPEWKGRKV